MVSPWVTFNQNSRSFQSNSSKDVVDAGVLKLWSDAFMGDAKIDEYNDPLSAEPQWWENTPVEKICFTGGADELFADDISAFAKKLKVGTPFDKVCATCETLC